MGDVPVIQGGNCDDGNGTSVGQLHGLLVDLREVGVQRTGHGVLRRNLVHTVAHDRKGVGVEGHIRKQHQHLFVLVHCKVLCGGKGHIGDEEALHGRLLGCVHEGDYLVECACAFEGVAEEEIVVVAEAHTSEDDLIDVGTEGHVGHHAVVGLVRVGEERNLLPGNQGVVEVDAGDTRRDEFRGLTALVRVHGRAAHLALFSFNLWASVDGMAIGIEETAGELLADFQGRRFSVEGNFGVGRDAFGAGEYLQGHQVSFGLDDLGEAAFDCGKLIVADACGVQGHGGLGYGLQAGIYFLICFICHFLRVLN